MESSTVTPQASTEDVPREVKEAVERNQRRREEKELGAATGEAREAREVVSALAQGEKGTSQEELADATEWFLSDDADEDYSYDLKLNVGTPKQEKWIKWTIRPVDLDTLRRIRQSSQGNRAQRRASRDGEIDEVQANLRIVVEGTVAPDLTTLAKEQGIAREEALRRRFRRKPGILGQIAAEIMGISGYDDEDVREVEAGNA